MFVEPPQWAKNQAAELLFKPILNDYMQTLPVHELITESIRAAGNDNKHDLESNVLLCGGTSNMTGFKERLDQELFESPRINLIAPENR